MSLSLEDTFRLCDGERNHHGLTLARSYEGFEAWFAAFENGSDKFDLHLTYMRELGIPKEEAFFILAYTGTHSSWINSELRNGEELSSRCKQAFAESLDQVLRKLTSFNNQIVYRMDIPHDDDEETRTWFDQHVGAKFEVPYYLSTAQKDYHNTPVVWKIQTLAADSFGKDISKLTNNEFEREVLFRRHAKFEILGIEHGTGYVMLQELTKDAATDFPLVGIYSRNY